MATPVSWRFDTDRDDGGILVNSLNADMPELSPGATMRLEMLFWDDDTIDEAASTGLTFSGNQGGTFGGSAGGTFGGVIDVVRNHRRRYREVREYCRYAGRAATNEAIDGTVHYRERLPSNADVPSIVVPLDPSGYLESRMTPGIWVLLQSYDDRTDNIPDTARLEVEATFLATTDQYATRSDIDNELGT